MFDGWRTRAPAINARGLRPVFVVFMGLSLVQMLSACIFSSERPDLAAEIPPRYGAGRGESAPPALDWWRGFRSRELTNLIEEAQLANFDIGAAIGRILQADAQAKIVGAPLLPAVNFVGFAERFKNPGAPERNLFHAALNASYEIDFWGKNRAISEAAQELAIAARFNRDVVAVSTVVSVATAYFLVVSAQERLRIARQNVAAAERILTLIKQRFDAGTASALEVAQQETLVTSQRVIIPALDQQLRQNEATLAALIGRAPAFLKVRGGSLYALGLPRVSAGLPSELLFQRPDIRAAEARLVSAEASVVAARAAFFPSITLTGEYGVTSAALKNLFTPQAIFYQIAANLAQPVFDGFRLEGQLEAAKGRQLELLGSYRRIIVTAFADVEQALIAVADSAELERLQVQALDAAQRAFAIAEIRLREGTVDLTTVLQLQQALFSAQDNRAQARLARLQAVLSLFQALGGSWLPPPPKDHVNVKQ